LSGFLGKDVQHRQALPGTGDVNRAGDAVPPGHSHFPQLAVQRPDVRHSYLVRAEFRWQFGNVQEPRANVRWQSHLRLELG